MKYRKEIDGLRALAVLPVLFFHAGFELFSGGFVGVDVFFVISGFLITGIIIKELNSQSFSISSFYERRARRILPALFSVLLLTTLAVLIWMPPDLTKDYGLSLLNVSTFTSNFYFSETSGYFATVAEEKPLLHTWSLAVEEQFYLLFPLILMVLYKVSNKAILIFLVAISVCSFLWSHYLLDIGQSAENFYLIFSRAWELFIGAIVAVVYTQRKQHGSHKLDILEWLGLFLIVVAVVCFDGGTPFPSVYALLPTVGTGLILFCSHEKSLLGRFLSSRYLVHFGLLSYSLYLWHQPVLAFIKLKSIGTPAISYLLLGLFISYLLTLISYHFIERPFRNRNWLSRKRIFTFSFLGLGVFLILGVSLYKYNGFAERYSGNNYEASTLASPFRKKCHTKGTDYLKPEEACRYFGDNINWAVLGDSHVVELAYVLAEKLKESDQGLLQLTFSGCPNAYTLDLAIPKGCSDWNHEAVNYLLTQDNIKNVVIGYRYSRHLFGNNLTSYPDIPEGYSPLMKLSRNYRKGMKGSAWDNYWYSFQQTIEVLNNNGKSVYVMYPVPELPIDFKKAAAPFSVVSNKSFADLNKITSYDYYLRRNEYILSKLDSLPYSDKLFAIKPAEVFCDNESCRAVDNQKALYFDGNHPSLYGAKMILDYYKKLLDIK